MSFRGDRESTEAEIVGNCRPDHLYTHEWANGEGKYLNLVIDEEGGQPSGIDVHLEPNARNRIKGTITFIRERNEIRKIEIKKFKHYKHKGWQPAPDDEGGVGNHRGVQALDENAKRTLRTFLIRQGGAEGIAELLRTDLIGSEDIVNLGYRKRQFALFQELLSGGEKVEAYQREHGIRTDQPEAAWQYFFARNQWIFAYGLDYRFQSVPQEQFHASDASADGSGVAIADYLLGDRRFTTFVEIKTPNTPLFAQSRNRARIWRLSSELLDSVSQILEHKASGLLRFERSELFDKNGMRITQRPYDPKVVLIIGHWGGLAPHASQVARQAPRARARPTHRPDGRRGAAARVRCGCAQGRAIKKQGLGRRDAEFHQRSARLNAGFRPIMIHGLRDCPLGDARQPGRGRQGGAV